MSKNNANSTNKGVSAQISFRHSLSVKQALAELSKTENLGESDLSRIIFNEGLKSRFGINIQGNQVVK